MDTPATTVQSLTVRIDRLERKVANYRRVSALVALTLITMGSMQARSRDQIGPVEATEFRLIDRSGEPVGMLTTAYGDPQLALMSKGGWHLSLTPRLIAQSKMAATSDLAFNMRVGADSLAAGFRFGGPGGSVRFISADGAPALELVDAEGRVRAILGRSALTRRATGSTEITAPASLVLFDEQGSTVWRAPSER
jgi:hypothetical protein